MKTALDSVCDAVKKIAGQLKPRYQPLSFVIVLGKDKQGKSAILQQSQMKLIELPEACGAVIAYNNHGIFLELSELWFSQQPGLIKNSLKQLNRCHKYLKISGLALCMDVNALLTEQHEHLKGAYLDHIQYLKRVKDNLGYSVACFIIMNKLDALAGFSEFYQDEHERLLEEALGLRLLLDAYDKNHRANHFKTRFDEVIESLGQKVIKKLHPARSSLKRTLIREFPIQVLGLRQPLFILVQKMAANDCAPQAIYFCSAAQGGQSVDHLNQKIQQEYALALQNHYTQACNYRPFFIKGCIEAIQKQSMNHPEPVYQNNDFMIKTLFATGAFILILQVGYHLSASQGLDEASKELIAYESLLNTPASPIDALGHLNQANQILLQKNDPLLYPHLKEVKQLLASNSNELYRQYYIPEIKNSLEHVIVDAGKTPAERYKALKIYLMLGEPEHLNFDEMAAWFKLQWQQDSPDKQQKKFQLLQSITRQPMQRYEINTQLVRDARNYLNALPSAYLYYHLAKDSFDKNTQALAIEGFNLPCQALPVYYSKAYYHKTLQSLKQVSKVLKQEHWVLGQKSPERLYEELSKAYHYDYVRFWQNFLAHSLPKRFNDFKAGRALFTTLKQASSINRMIELVQSQTNASTSEEHSEFNRVIASQFTDLNLINQSSLTLLQQNIIENEKFLSTLSVINDKGQTAFRLTKARFMSKRQADPVSMLYEQSEQMPEPIAHWLNQLADDSWSLLIKEARQHINRQWQETIIPVYRARIAAHYPLDPTQTLDIKLEDFNQFFSPDGQLKRFHKFYIKPFLDTSAAQWKPKTIHGFMMPVSEEMINALMQANIISNMFFPNASAEARVSFSLEKINLDPIVSQLKLQFGRKELVDTQETNSYMRFEWPSEDVRLSLNSINGEHYELSETGFWAMFRLMEKINVIPHTDDPSAIEILFEVNTNSGRYLMRTASLINPFLPGIFKHFHLDNEIV